MNTLYFWLASLLPIVYLYMLDDKLPETKKE